MSIFSPEQHFAITTPLGRPPLEIDVHLLIPIVLKKFGIVIGEFQNQGPRFL